MNIFVESMILIIILAIIVGLYQKYTKRVLFI